jgi:hypothetical protein
MGLDVELAAEHLQIIRDRLVALKLRVAEMEGCLSSASQNDGRLSLRIFTKQFLDGSLR